MNSQKASKAAPIKIKSHMIINKPVKSSEGWPDQNVQLVWYKNMH